MSGYTSPILAAEGMFACLLLVSLLLGGAYLYLMLAEINERLRMLQADLDERARSALNPSPEASGNG